MTDRIKAWWWIVRHPSKSAAIRRYLEDPAHHDSGDSNCKFWTGDRPGTNPRAHCRACGA